MKELILIERKPLPKGLKNRELIDMRIHYVNAIVKLRRGILSKADIYKKRYQEYKKILNEVLAMERQKNDAEDRLGEVMDGLNNKR